MFWHRKYLRLTTMVLGMYCWIIEFSTIILVFKYLLTTNFAEYYSMNVTTTIFKSYEKLCYYEDYNRTGLITYIAV